MWARVAVCGPVAINVVLVAENMGQRLHLFAHKVVPILPCLWSRAVNNVVHYTYSFTMILT